MELKKIRDECISRLKGIQSSKRGMTIICIAGIVGMMMILFSDGKDDEINEIPINEAAVEQEWADYTLSVEARLKEILSAIDGVGAVEVMVMAGTSERYSYAQNESINERGEEREYVTLKKGSSEEPVVMTVCNPEITGVVVVCQGGGSDRVCETIYRSVTSALDIPYSRVYVAKMK